MILISSLIVFELFLWLFLQGPIIPIIPYIILPWISSVYISLLNCPDGVQANQYQYWMIPYYSHDFARDTSNRSRAAVSVRVDMFRLLVVACGFVSHRYIRLEFTLIRPYSCVHISAGSIGAPLAQDSAINLYPLFWLPFPGRNYRRIETFSTCILLTRLEPRIERLKEISKWHWSPSSQRKDHSSYVLQYALCLLG